MLLLSGAMGSGKTAIAQALEKKAGFRRISTSGYLRQYGEGLGPEGQRLQLQDLGDRLDRETDFRWVVDGVVIPAFATAPEAPNWLLDAARKPEQIVHLRERIGPPVRHVHLTAPEEVLRERYTSRLSATDTPYDDAIRHPNEIAARGLESVADLLIDTGSLEASAAVSRILSLWEA